MDQHATNAHTTSDSRTFDVAAGDAVYIPAGFGHAIKNTGDDNLEIVQTWDKGKFEEIDLDRWVRSSPNYLLANNFFGASPSTIAKMKETYAIGVSLHGRKRGWRQQLAADVRDELAILLRLGDHRGPSGIGEKSAWERWRTFRALRR
jgi:hypothetical protein